MAHFLNLMSVRTAKNRLGLIKMLSPQAAVIDSCQGWSEYLFDRLDLTLFQTHRHPSHFRVVYLPRLITTKVIYDTNKNVHVF